MASDNGSGFLEYGVSDHDVASAVKTGDMLASLHFQYWRQTTVSS